MEPFRQTWFFYDMNKHLFKSAVIVPIRKPGFTLSRTIGPATYFHLSSNIDDFSVCDGEEEQKDAFM